MRWLKSLALSTDPLFSIRQVGNRMASTATATPQLDQATLDVSVVIPCLNEAETIAACIRKAKGAIERRGLAGEVIVVDNGSTDGSPQLATAEGADVIQEPRRGYGNAYLAGLAAAR